MATIAVCCVVWTTWLIVLTLQPNEMANFLMGTGDLDDGRFWLIVDPDPEIKYLGVCGLAIVDAAYVFVLFKIFFQPLKCGARSWFSASGRIVPERTANNTWWMAAVDKYNRASSCWRELTSYTGRNRKIWNIMLKTLDLGMHFVQLAENLEGGFPAALVRTYAVFLSCNALSCAVTITWSQHSALTEVLVDSMFDLCAAVVYPIFVLVYCWAEFDFDRDAFQLYVTYLHPGTYERHARLIASPSEIALFLACFDSLRILHVDNLLLRIGMNLSFCNRFRGVADAVRLQQRVKSSSVGNRLQGDASSSPHNSSQRRVPRMLATVFVGVAVAAIVYSERAMAESWSLCADYSQCVVFAQRWDPGETCPCLVFVGLDTHPRTYAEWMNPPIDATDAVRALSASGDLRVLQLVNHGLTRWPDELRRCHNLQYVSMINTGLVELPTWAKAFRNLQHFHFEGKEMFPNLQHMDEDLFSDMPHLVYLHIAVNDDLRAFPPLNGVPRLQSLVIAHMFSITQLPSFDNLRELQRLELPYMPALASLPDLTPLTNLVHFATSGTPNFCCNGFLGSCDLSDLFCVAHPAIGIPAPRCIDDSRRISPSSAAVLARFSSSVCRRNKQADIRVGADFLTKESIDVCNGKMFQRCEYPKGSGRVGICYNNRLQVVSCFANPNYIALRRAQIVAGIGLLCDPSVEQWLGCTK